MLGRSGRAVVLAMAIGSLLAACDKVSPDELLQRAEQSIASKQYHAAAIDLRAALQQDPQSARARWLLGELYLTMEDGLSAEKELRRASELGVQDDSVLPLLARALLLQGRTEEVLAMPSLGVSAGAAGELASSRALAFLAKGELASARREIDLATELDQSSPNVRYALAKVLVAEGLPDQALTALDSLQKLYPDYLLAWVLRGDIFKERGEFSQAEEAYTKAVEYDLPRPRDRVKRAFARLAQGKVDAAEADAALLLKMAPRSPEVQYLAGLIHVEKGDFPAANDALELAYSVSRDNHPVVLALASTKLVQGNINGARELAERALALAPNDIPSRKLLAEIRLRDRKGAEAESLLAPVVRSQPGDLESKRMLASSLYMQGKLNEASQVSREIAAAMQESPEAQSQAGIGLMASGATEEGLAALQRAVDLAPEEQSFNALLIAGLMETGQEAEAIATAEKLAQEKPNDAEALNLLAFTHLANRDAAQAKVVFRRALQLDPANRAAARTLASLALSDGDATTARSYLGPALKTFPNDVRLLLLSAEAARQVGNFAEMEAYLYQVIEADPSNIQARVLLARRMLENNETEKALAVLAPTDGSRDVDVLLVKADAYYRLARLQDARRALESLTEVMPDSVQVHLDLARVYGELGNDAGLTRELDRVLQLSPDDAPARLAKSRLLVNEGKFAEADALLDGIDLPANDPRVLAARSAIASSAGRPDAAAQYSQSLFTEQPTARNAVMLSRAQAKAGQLDASIQTLDDWLVAHPQDIPVITELANLYLAQERLNDYLNQLRRILVVDPNSVFALNNLAWSLRKTAPAEALGYARRAYEKMPASSPVLDTLAIVLAENKDFDGALRMITKAVELADEPAMFRVRRAEIRLMSGDKEGAIAELDVLLQEPISEEVRKQAEAQLQRAQS